MTIEDLIMPNWGFVGELCKSIGLEVFIDDISDKEKALQVRVASTGILQIGELRSLYVNVFYSPDQFQIRCYPQVGDAFHFDFRLCNSALSVCYRGEAATPEETANKIIKPLAQAVRDRRR